MKDSYHTISSESIGEFKDRGSKFIAYATPLSYEGDFNLFLDKIKKLHPKAKHYCYAWRLGLDKNHFRANDDGEPSGTAGRPILGQIDSFGLTNIGVIVVRYFGGTLLGTSGLINAYKESATEVLRQSTIIEKIIEDIFEIRFTYEKMSDVMNAVKRLNINILEQKFDENGRLLIAIRQSEVEQKKIHLRALIMKISIDEAQLLEKNTQITSFGEGVIISHYAPP
jgi:uncharacterized YigZ family protein